DDTVAMPLDALDHYFTISPFGHHPEPIAGAGYDVFSTTIGQLAGLVAAAQRTNGYATFMLARAAEECMFDGLIPQCVIAVGDEIGEKMAADVGFLLSGFGTSVTFGYRRLKSVRPCTRPTTLPASGDVRISWAAAVK